MKKTLVLLLALSFTLVASASVKLKVKDEVQLFAAIQSLDLADQVIKVDGKQQVVKLPYKFTGKVRLALARDLVILQGSVDSFNKARDLVFKSYSPDGKSIDQNNPKYAEISKQIMEMEDRTDSLSLERLVDGDLNLDENQIPSSIIAILAPILN